MEIYQIKLKEKMVLDMINFYSKKYKITFGQMKKKKKILMDHRYIAYKKLKKKVNIL